MPLVTARSAGDRAIARIPLACPLAAAAGLLLLTGLVVANWVPLAELDAAVIDQARCYGHTHPGAIKIQRRVTDTAQTAVFFGVGLASAVVLLLARRAYAAAALIVAAFAATPAIWCAFHALLHRPRPAAGFVGYTSNGFPSGHATNSATLALVAVLLVWPRARAAGRTLAVCSAAVFVLAIGLTRVSLLAHWPSDVLGGWLLAVTAVPLVARAVVALAPAKPTGWPAWRLGWAAWWLDRPLGWAARWLGRPRTGDRGDSSGDG